MKRTMAFVLMIFLVLLSAACHKDIENGGDEELKIIIGADEFAATLYDNETVRALKKLLPMTINMNELNGNEKYHYLPDNLTALAERPATIQEGDIMLYGSNCLVLFYKSFSTSYSYTKIGRIENTTGLAAALGSGNVVITFLMK